MIETSGGNEIVNNTYFIIVGFTRYKSYGWGEVGEKKSAPRLKVVFKEDAKIR